MCIVWIVQNHIATEDGKGNMDTQTFCTITEKNIYLSDKVLTVLSHFIRKFHKPTLRGDL